MPCFEGICHKITDEMVVLDDEDTWGVAVFEPCQSGSLKATAFPTLGRGSSRRDQWYRALDIC